MFIIATSGIGSRKAIHSTGSVDSAILMIIILSSFLRQVNTYLPFCELFHVFSDTGGRFLCDRLKSYVYSGLWVQGAGSWLCSSLLLRQTYLYVENSFVDFYCCQMVTDFLNVPQYPTKISTFSSIINSPCICHETTTDPFGALHDMVWRIFINISEELLPTYLANIFAEGFSETPIRSYKT
jgi:hypothetical protein